MMIFFSKKKKRGKKERKKQRRDDHSLLIYSPYLNFKTFKKKKGRDIYSLSSYLILKHPKKRNGHSSPLSSPLLPPTLYSSSPLKFTNTLYIYAWWKKLFRGKKKKHSFGLIPSTTRFFKKSNLIFKHKKHLTLFESFHAPPCPLFPPSSLVIIHPPYATQKVPCAYSCNKLVVIGLLKSRPIVGYMQMGPTSLMRFSSYPQLRSNLNTFDFKFPIHHSS